MVSSPIEMHSGFTKALIVLNRTEEGQLLNFAVVHKLFSPFQMTDI